MKNPIILLIFIFSSITCRAQTLYGTFQGEVEGVSRVIIHLKAEDGSVEGFYKYLSDSVVVFIKGSMDRAGNLLLTGRQNLYPDIEGKLTGRIIEGNIVLSNNAERHYFYAVDLRGEYRNQHHLDYLSLFLSPDGYMLKDLSRTGKEQLITTFRSKDGIIGLCADSLDTTMYLHSDTLIVDTTRGLPIFISPDGEFNRDGLSFTPDEEFWSSDSFVEFPEKNEDFIPEGSLRELDDTITLRVTQIPRSEYVIGKWTAPRNGTYRANTDFNEAKKLLGEKMKPVEELDQETGELLSAKMVIIYNDGSIKKMEWLYDLGTYPEAFYAYYPELDILVIEGEAGGDEIIDFNDSSSRREVGNPARTATSPDGRWRITGYYPGGAIDTDHWWLERWNPSINKYQMAGDFINNYRTGEESFFKMPTYIDGWLWIDNRTVLFTSLFPEGMCYKLEVITEPVN